MRRTLSYRLAHNLRHENLEVFVIEDAAKAILHGAIHGDGEAADMGEGDGKTAVFVPLSLSITSAPLESEPIAVRSLSLAAARATNPR